MTALLASSQAFFQNLSVNRCSEMIVRWGSGPFVTKILTQGQDKSDKIFKISIVAHLFWIGVHPLTTQKFFMHQERNWQTQLLGFLGGWSITYFVTNTYLKRVESLKSSTEKATEASRTVSNNMFSNITSIFNNPFSFFSILSDAFDPKTDSVALKATVIPCAVALASHVKLYVSRQLSL